MKFIIAALATGVTAFPTVMDNLVERDNPSKAGCTTSKQCNAKYPVTDKAAGVQNVDPISAARTNCGIGSMCTTFDAKSQSISTTGLHAYKSPGANQIRGPCPGLNAAANHGYLPRSGVLSYQSSLGLDTLYGLAPDFIEFLDAYSIAMVGDISTMTWSIGGPTPPTLLSPLGAANGISYSHNNYEGDTSITRCDAYTNGGDAHSSSPTRFMYAWLSGQPADRYTLDTMARLYAKNTIRSVNQNAYYFAPLFSTTIVSPAAYNFVINFMSNHSEAEPAGYLDSYNFMSFFGYTGKYPNFYWQRGQERIPENWYRRPLDQTYDAPATVADDIVDFKAYPKTFRFGGNINGKGTYTGIDISNLTNGAYNADTLFEDNNFGCFLFQNEQQVIPLQFDNGVNTAAEALALITKAFPPALGSKATCPKLGKYDATIFQQYTGYGYKPGAPSQVAAVNC